MRTSLVLVAAVLAASRAALAAPPVAPDPPSSVAATAANGVVHLSWSASANALGYEVVRGSAPGAATTIAVLGSSATVHADVSAPGPGGLYYRIRAVGAHGVALSDEVYVPGPATLGATSKGDDAIDLHWTAVAGATRYDLFRSASSAGPFSTPVASVPATAGLSYGDAMLTHGTEYFYVVRAVAAVGSGTGTSIESPVARAATGPAAVTLSSVAAFDDRRIDLTWTSSSRSATCYRVSRRLGSGAAVEVARVATATLTFADVSLSGDTRYSFTVTALDETNSTSSRPSNELAATTAPAAPVLSAGTRTASSIQLAWSVSPGATSYRVFTGPAGGPYAELPGSPTSATALIHSGLSGNTYHTYVARSVGPSGTSAESLPFTLGTAPPVLGWTDLASTSVIRYGIASATGADGRIYVLGGYTGGLPDSSVEAYTPATDTWAPVTHMHTPRIYHAAVAGPDGRIYAIGGVNASGTPQKSVEAYNPVTGTWTSLAPMGTARYFLAAALGPDGRIYAIGGYDTGFLASVEAYSPLTNTWTTVAPMSAPRDELAAATGTDGRIYAMGGLDSAGLVGRVEAYDPGTNSWTTVAPLPVPREFLSAVTGPDGRIYALGGATSRTHAIVDLYEPASGTWTPGPPMNTDRQGFGAALGPDRRLYVIGGYSSTQQHLAKVEAFAP